MSESDQDMNAIDWAQLPKIIEVLSAAFKQFAYTSGVFPRDSYTDAVITHIFSTVKFTDPDDVALEILDTIDSASRAQWHEAILMSRCVLGQVYQSFVRLIVDKVPYPFNPLNETDLFFFFQGEFAAAYRTCLPSKAKISRGDLPNVDKDPLSHERPSRRGRQSEAWNQRAATRLKNGEDETLVRAEWRDEFCKGKGIYPAQTVDGEQKTWDQRVIRLYRQITRDQEE